MAKKYETVEQAATAFGVGKLKRHLFVCVGPDCVDLETGDATWQYLKRRLKELNIAGSDGPCYRTRCHCLRMRTAGPSCRAFPRGARDRDATPAREERLTQ